MEDIYGEFLAIDTRPEPAQPGRSLPGVGGPLKRPWPIWRAVHRKVDVLLLDQASELGKT